MTAAPETGTKLLIPSVSSTDRYKSSLVVVNREEEANEIVITAFGVSGEIVATLSERASFEVPDTLVERHMSARTEGVARDLAYQGIDPTKHTMA